MDKDEYLGIVNGTMGVMEAFRLINAYTREIKDKEFKYAHVKALAEIDMSIISRTVNVCIKYFDNKFNVSNLQDKSGVIINKS